MKDWKTSVGPHYPADGKWWVAVRGLSSGDAECALAALRAATPFQGPIEGLGSGPAAETMYEIAAGASAGAEAIHAYAFPPLPPRSRVERLLADRATANDQTRFTIGEHGAAWFNEDGSVSFPTYMELPDVRRLAAWLTELCAPDVSA